MRNSIIGVTVGTPTSPAKIAKDLKPEIKEYIDECFSEKSYANAIKGTESGAVVAMDDVSPIPHKVGVKVGIENVIPYPYSSKSGFVNSGITFTINADKSVTLNGTASGTPIFYLWTSGDNKPVPFISGKSYTIGGVGDRQGDLQIYVVYKDETGKTNYKPSGSIFTWQSTYTLDYIQIQVSNAKTFVDYIVSPVIKDASIADATMVMIKCLGKNLIPYPTRKSTTTHNGITFTDNGDGTWTLNGTATADAYVQLYDMATAFNLQAGTYTFGWNKPEGNGIGVWLQGKLMNGDISIDVYETIKSKTFTVERAERLRFNIRVSNGTTCNNVIVKPQLELNTVATEFEPYVIHEEVTTTVAEGAELNSVSPNMTILPYVNGVNLECSYNRDSNKVIEKLTQAIISLGGMI